MASLKAMLIQGYGPLMLDAFHNTIKLDMLVAFLEHHMHQHMYMKEL